MEKKSESAKKIVADAYLVSNLVQMKTINMHVMPLHMITTASGKPFWQGWVIVNKWDKNPLIL